MPIIPAFARCFRTRGLMSRLVLDLGRSGAGVVVNALRRKGARQTTNPDLNTLSGRVFWPEITRIIGRYGSKPTEGPSRQGLRQT